MTVRTGWKRRRGWRIRLELSGLPEPLNYLRAGAGVYGILPGLTQCCGVQALAHIRRDEIFKMLPGQDPFLALGAPGGRKLVLLHFTPFVISSILSAV